jgi:hypothetical protein
MSRYLPDRYEPIPDELLRSGANLWDVTRRISRNQNWLWANLGATFAAWGGEPLASQTAVVSTGSARLELARQAAPLRSMTGSEYLRVRCFYSVDNFAIVDARLVLYQLLPGETNPTPGTPSDSLTLDDPTASFAPAQGFATATARVRCGSDPLRLVVRIETGASHSATLTIHSVSILWEPLAAGGQVGGETAEAWMAISQGFAAPDRTASAVFLRALSNRTLGLVAARPAPILSHSFMWNRGSVVTSGADHTLGRYAIVMDRLSSSGTVSVTVRYLVAGQNARVTPWVDRVHGSFNRFTGDWNVSKTRYTGSLSAAPTLINGAYVAEFEQTISVPYTSAVTSTQFAYLDVGAIVTTGSGASAYAAPVGVVLLSVNATQALPTAADLALPGADTVPTAYVPLDDAACAPGRSVLAQDDRFGARAGPYYLVRNLIWLAANRGACTLIADWLHRTQSAGWSGAGDGYYRNQTLVSTNGQQYPAGGDVVPWTSAANPTNAATVASGGQHYPGIVLAKMDCRPLNGGRVGVLARPEILAMPGSSPTNEVFTALWADIGAAGSGANLGTVSTAPGNIVGGFLRLPTGSVKPTAGQDLRIRGTMQNDTSDSDGRIIALHSLYAYEEPLTQANLDALP